MSGIIHSWPIEIDFNRAQIRSRIRESDILDLKAPASYIVFTDGVKYYAKNGSTGIIEYSDTDASNVIQYAIDNTVASGKWGTVHLADGVYNLSKTITLYSGVGLKGTKAGWRTDTGTLSTVLVGRFNDVIIKIVNHPQYKSTSPYYIFPYIAELAIVGDYNSSNNVGIYVSDENGDIYDIVLRNVYVYNVGSDGLRISSASSKTWMSDSYFEWCAGAGINLVKFSKLNVVNAYIFYNNPNILIGSGATGSAMFTNAVIINSKSNGIVVNGSSTLLLSNCDISSNNGYALYNYAVPVIHITNCTIVGNSKGIFSGNGYILISNSRIQNNCSSSGCSQVEIAGGRAVIVGNLFMETRSPKVADYHIKITGGEVAVVGNHMPPSFSGALGIINEAGGTRLIRDNYGYTNVSSGVATISAGSTRITVSHGLVTAPSKVIITPLGQPPGKLWVENITSTSFDIVIDTAPSSNLNVAWYAEV